MVRTYTTLLASLFLVTTLTWHEWNRSADGIFHAYFFDVGQGDSALLVGSDGTQILVDGGADLSTLEQLGDVMPFLDRSIDMVVLTHPHADHLTALPEALKRYDVGAVMMTGVYYESSLYDAFMAILTEHNIPIIDAVAGQTLLVGSLTLDILWPAHSVWNDRLSNINNSSIAFIARDNEHTLFMSGDIEHDVEAALVRSGMLYDIDVLKVPHHGSKTSSTEELLRQITPEIVVVSVGEDNHYGHPHNEVIARLEHYAETVYLTRDKGMISLALTQ